MEMTFTGEAFAKAEIDNDVQLLINCQAPYHKLALSQKQVCYPEVCTMKKVQHAAPQLKSI